MRMYTKCLLSDLLCRTQCSSVRQILLLTCFSPHRDIDIDPHAAVTSHKERVLSLLVDGRRVYNLLRH